jgi:uncharacterized protein
LKSLREFSIPFTGLKLGKHQFEFVITDAFFDQFEYSLVKKASLVCKVELERQEPMLILDFDITGTVDATCDKCLAQYPQPVDIPEQQVAKFSEEPVADDEEIIALSKNDHEIDIAGLVYEYINVAVPFITTCGDEGNTPFCDKEMLDKLEKFKANTDNDEKTDPRWDVLKNIK